MNFSRLHICTGSVLLLTLLCTNLTDAQHTGESSQSAWEMLSSSGDEPMERHENAYVKSGGRFYLIGGRGDRPVQIYDPETDSWTTGATPPIEMHHFQAVSLNNKIYVIGALTGGFPDEDPIANVYVYNPEQDKWTKGPEIPDERRRGAAGAVVHNDLIYIVGGIQNGHLDGHVAWLDRFDPEGESWETLPDAPHVRDHFQAGIVDGKLYAAGGRRSSHATGESFELTIPEVDVFDLETESWTTLPSSADLPTERAGSTTITVDEKLIVIGGESGSQEEAHTEAEAYDPQKGEWSSMPSLTVGRHGTQAVVHDEAIYIAAGSKMRGADEINSQERLRVNE